MNKKIAVLTAGIIIIAAISPVSADFTCERSHDENSRQWKTIKSIFVKKTNIQQITQVCTHESLIFILLEETDPNRIAIRAGMYIKNRKKKYIEKFSNNAGNYCEIEPSSNAKKINYICYNPTVAADKTEGDEFSFHINGKKSYSRPCTVYFGAPEKTKCGEWSVRP